MQRHHMLSKAMVLSLIPAVMAFLAGAVLPFQTTSNGTVGMPWVIRSGELSSRLRSARSFCRLFYGFSKTGTLAHFTGAALILIGAVLIQHTGSTGGETKVMVSG
ncbi:hypothetical protein [Xenorhabdus szentirmaii]|uniref:hypothetical protein n=1 Tax=Xenorhabdus szentirmaii TaxID=290112 RepID=UPI00117C934C|nr:hypothetical protein [Xenorhabdus szentirmaii]